MKSVLQETSQLTDIPSHMCGWLEVDLDQISRNYQTLKNKLPSAECAAVVKANAYGLGLEPVSQRLYQDGCRQFFVAHVEEGVALRKALPHATIYVFTGCLPNMEQEFLVHNLTPVLNDYSMLERWGAFGRKQGKKLPALLHVDTGMHRIGFDTHDLQKLKESIGILETLELRGVMSHLACSPDPDHEQNETQRALFDDICKNFPSIPKSLADTAGIYLGEAYHYDFIRPGKGLFGLFQAPCGPELEQAFSLKSRIIQIRLGQVGDVVGYGSQAKLGRDSTLATLGLGYGDGLDRRLAIQGFVLIGGHKAPIVGSLSMDYTVVDVTDIPPSLLQVGGWAEITGPQHPLEDIAKDLGTISRELSTRLGNRLYRTELI